MARSLHVFSRAILVEVIDDLTGHLVLAASTTPTNNISELAISELHSMSVGLQARSEIGIMLSLYVLHVIDALSDLACSLQF